MISALAVTWLLFVFYLAYCTLNAMWKRDRFASLPLPAKVFAGTTLAVAVVLDVLFNVTIGSTAFLELPEWRRATFTMRCKKHMHADTWRGKLARWVCEGWLNPAEPGHC